MKNLLILGVIASAAAFVGIAADSTAPTPEAGTSGSDSGYTTTHVTRQNISESTKLNNASENGREKASTDCKTVILYEDFGNIPEGNTESISGKGERYVDIIASRNQDPGRYLSEEYTPSSGKWEGDDVYAGKGGTVILQCSDPTRRAVLNTPLGDYSGDITVTVLCRWAKTYWRGESETGYLTTNGSELTIGVYTGGYDKPQYARTDIGGRAEMDSGRMYDTSGWQEITFKFHNESANSDGFISFFTGESVEIDCIKITDDNAFLPIPVMNEPSDFVSDGFTISWHPVRRAYSYYIDLYKMVYTADSGLDETCDFEKEDTPSWLDCEGMERVAGEGRNESACMVIPDDQTYMSTVNSGFNLGKFSSEVKFQLESPDSPIIAKFEVYGENGWVEYTSIECDGYWCDPDTYYDVTFDGKSFSGKYSAVRVSAEGTNENNKVFIDNVSVYAERPYELKRVYDDELSLIGDPDNEDFVYNYYDITKEDHYTFKNLDPETEYWYRIRSQYMMEFGITETMHAFGVATPEVLSASDVTDKSYTANWKDVPKAQKYMVINYDTHAIAEDDPEYSLVSETFSNCTGNNELSGMEPANNTAECYLDEYTDIRGWRGINNHIGKNMLGCGDGGNSYLVTPMMMLNQERGNALVYINAIGTPGDLLIFKSLKNGRSGTISFDDNGVIDGVFELEAVSGEQLKLYSFDDLAFAVKGFEVMQAVLAGDTVRTFNQLIEVAPGQESVTFNNLTQPTHAYEVIASFTLEKNTVLSAPGKVEYVGEDTGVTLPENEIGTEVARYSVDGCKVGKDYKGIVLILMDNGTVKKVIAN